MTRRIRWPISGWAPCHRSELHLARRGALGDVLLCTPALRELHRINPNTRLTFYTDFPDLIRGLPGIHSVLPYAERSPLALEFVYESSIPPLRHIAKIMGDCIGVDVQDVRPICAMDLNSVEHWRSRLDHLARPIAVINRSAGPFTPNKDWPASHWDELVERLCQTGSAVEIGTGAAASSPCRRDRFLDLRGQTTIKDLIAVVAASDVHVGPISGPVHIAAAVGTPSVVIFGGYEDPVGTHYGGNLDLFTQLACSPCWLRDACPYDRKCLQVISPATVQSGILKVLETRSALSMN